MYSESQASRDFQLGRLILSPDPTPSWGESCGTLQATSRFCWFSMTSCRIMLVAYISYIIASYTFLVQQAVTESVEELACATHL